MSSLVSTVNQILSLLTIAGQAAIVFGLAVILARNRKIGVFLGENALLFSFIVALIATLGSLFYSEAAHFEPCKLCWFQRILMYPQTILLGLALFKKDKNILGYAFWLSLTGAVIALYHYLLQIGIAPSLSCSATGYSASCSQRFVMNFGYITIPMMALTAFLMNIVFAAAQKLYNKNI